MKVRLLVFFWLFLNLGANAQVLENYDGLWKSAREESWLGSNNQIELKVDLTSFPESELRIKLPSKSTVFIDGKLWQLTTGDTVFFRSIREFQAEFDKEKAKQDGRTDLGGDIMIHGKSVTIGCIPVGDKNIEEIFILATKTKNKHFPIIIAPHDFRTNKTFPKIEAISWEKDLYENISNELNKY